MGTGSGCATEAFFCAILQVGELNGYIRTYLLRLSFPLFSFDDRKIDGAMGCDPLSPFLSTISDGGASFPNFAPPPFFFPLAKKRSVPTLRFGDEVPFLS